MKTKSVLRNIGFLLSVPVLIGAFVFAVAEDKESNVQAIEVQVLNPEYGFVSAKDIEYALKNENVILDHTAVRNLNVAALEEKVNSNPWIAHAEVFVTAQQSIKVKLLQVEPKLRVQRTDSTSNGYYLDAQGMMIPLSKQFAADLPILTAEKSIRTRERRKELVDFAQYIEADTFWQASISQINVNRNGEIELMSLIGDADILFGSLENKEDKFYRLFQFYKKGINRMNWANVKELDVRFDNQIVCRRYHKESQIEESKAPRLYAKTEVKPIQKIVTPGLVSKPQQDKKEASAKQALAEKDVLKRRKVVSRKVWDAEKPKSKTVVKTKKKPAVKTRKKEVVKRTTSKKNTKKIVAKKTATKNEPKPKARKKKREIIINTEPVTKND